MFNKKRWIMNMVEETTNAHIKMPFEHGAKRDALRTTLRDKIQQQTVQLSVKTG